MGKWTNGIKRLSTITQLNANVSRTKNKMQLPVCFGKEVWADWVQGVRTFWQIRAGLWRNPCNRFSGRPWTFRSLRHLEARRWLVHQSPKFRGQPAAPEMIQWNGKLIWLLYKALFLWQNCRYVVYASTGVNTYDSFSLYSVHQSYEINSYIHKNLQVIDVSIWANITD